MSSEGSGATSRADALAASIDRWVHRIAGRWLLIFNVLVALYLALPLAAPVLMHTGSSGAAGLLYAVFRPQCHQLPERSFFLFGRKAVYSLEELDTAHVLPGLSLDERSRYVGDEELGYKVGFCQRDVATWGAILVTGLAFGLTGRRWRPLPIWAWALSLIPMALDGGTQLLGLRESNWPLRTLSGALFGLATVLLAYPHVQEAMLDIAGARRTP